jgi:type IV secretory pathway VirJ component
VIGGRRLDSSSVLEKPVRSSGFFVLVTGDGGWRARENETGNSYVIVAAMDF